MGEKGVPRNTVPKFIKNGFGYQLGFGFPVELKILKKPVSKQCRYKHTNGVQIFKYSIIKR
jgi:hypothetical protein